MYFSEFKGNFKPVNDLRTLLSGSKHAAILVVGPLSTGKSSLYTMLQNEKKYEILLVTDSNFSPNTVTSFVQHRTIGSFFQNHKKIIFMDDIDVISANKNVIGLVTELKSACTFIMTIKSSEEKKFNNTWKKTVDHKIYLNQLNHKECFQVLLERYMDDDTIDHDKLIQLIKAQNCNIANVVMLIDQARQCDSDNDDIPIQHANTDLFHHNVYSLVHDIYHKNLTPEFLDSISNKDNSIICPLIHENLVQVPLDIDDYINIYDTLCDTDIVDKHVYIHCLWNINWSMNNYMRFKTINDALTKKRPFKQFDIAFTQQFTKLSSQMNIKKKIAVMPHYMQFTNMIDALYNLSRLKAKKVIAVSDKSMGDMIQKFDKDYKIA